LPGFFDSGMLHLLKFELFLFDHVSKLVAAAKFVRGKVKDRLMRAILDHCGAIPLEHIAGGSVILEECQTTGRVYVLVEGHVEVLRGGTQIAVLDEPGSLIGEMSVLLGVPHTATARALERFPITWNHVIDKESPKFKELEHVLVEKVEQLFRDML
jgi:CRP-like cAMP-binding protein